MYIEEEFYFWKLTHDLIVNHGFDILHINEQNSEVWLEKEVERKNHVVRLYRGQFDWSNQLKKDIARIHQHIEQNKHMFLGRELLVHAVYVSEFGPVDNWDGLERPLKVKGKKEIHLNVHYLNQDTREERQKKLYQQLKLEPEVIVWSSDVPEIEHQLPYLKDEILFQRNKKRKEQEGLFNYGKPLLTKLLLIANILIYFYLEMNGGSTSVVNLIEYGAKYNPAIVDGEWWRIISSMFLHIGLLHIMMNMLALYYLGTAVERIYGTTRFFLIYFLAGMVGGISSFAFNPHVAAGASGAIFGLFGALLYFGVMHKQVFFRTMGRNLIFIIVLNIILGLSVPQIDNGAHLGGLAGGFIASAAVNLPKNIQPIRQAASLLLYLTVLIGLGFYGYQQSGDTPHTAAEVEISQQMLQEEKYKETISFTEEAMERGGEYESYLLFNQAYAHFQLQDLKAARQDLEHVIEIDPDMAEAHYNLALVQFELGNRNSALSHANKAVNLMPDNEKFRDFYERLSE
ncbi:rhomboid family intramembrane serine protease [Thalassobacillus pellis]|uniref:rhomboid family intramembrane serine protease n=1 Tax=Thalassobacillus pellis TaxID=748008 RepID=UPI00195F3FDC|nr:rhomboid family intramembrane serine protease [Thalassobacillus pellis]MBM7552284.1 rhomboid protease GluP [Thalassobacillus pellis]